MVGGPCCVKFLKRRAVDDRSCFSLSPFLSVHLLSRLLSYLASSIHSSRDRVRHMSNTKAKESSIIISKTAATDQEQEKELQELRDFFAGVAKTKISSSPPQKVEDPGAVAHNQFHEQFQAKTDKLIQDYAVKIEKEVAAVDSVCIYAQGLWQMGLYLRKNWTTAEAKNKMATIFPELLSFADHIAYIEWNSIPTAYA
jgi:hypothetical protein